jgi:glyoxylase-like metal-dependent hydrolase (beta-lactamase superfamily II)
MTQGYQLHQIKVSFLSFKNYIYFIVDNASKQAAIIDPAWELNSILNVLKELDVKLTTILLTHSHFDHTNMAESLSDRFNAQIYISKLESTYYNFQCKNQNYIKHLDKINLGQTLIHCLLTPGHTAGSTCFLLTNSLLAGDTIFIEGCGICDTPGGNPEEMFESIQLIKRIVNPEVKVYPGHSFGKKPGYSLDSLMRENIYFQIEKKEQFVSFRMRNNQKNLFKFL